MIRWNGYSRLVFAAGLSAAACGPTARIPSPLPLAVPAAVAPDDSLARLARALAPVLYLQSDEGFRLERVVAVVHPTQPIIAYHMLWRDDVHGAWLPFTIPTDQEIVWVAHDRSGAPTMLWTYWHRWILRTDWRGKGYVAVDVQWGKHGSMPRNMLDHQLPNSATLNLFYAYTWLGLPDTWLSALQRPGPMCFCRSYRRYRQHTIEVPLSGRIDVVVRAEDPGPALAAVFGRPYSRKSPWPSQDVRDAGSRMKAARVASPTPD